MRQSLQLIIFMCCCQLLLSNRPAETFDANRVITVRDGLPQSYVSGIVQDARGFLWVATLNGLGRYDGREFKSYLHQPSDPEGISGNIILHLFDVGNDNMWLCYSDGRIDQFNTRTEKVTHLWKNKSFAVFTRESRNFKTLIRNNKGTAWMLAGDGSIYRIHLRENDVEHFTQRQLPLRESIIGLAVKDERLLLFTKTNMAVCGEDDVSGRPVPYPFKQVETFNTSLQLFYSPAIRTNGDMILADAKGLKIWNTGSRTVKEIPIPNLQERRKLIYTFDSTGNFFFESDSAIYRLNPANMLEKWSGTSKKTNGLPITMMTDQSGVMWVGSNGFGLRQYNLFKNGLPGYENGRSFVTDVLMRAGVSSQQLSATFLNSYAPFANRMATLHDSVWVSEIYLFHPDITLLLFANGKVSGKTFHEVALPGTKEQVALSFIAAGEDGSLWGIDHSNRLIRFDRQRLSYQFYGTVNIQNGEEVNGLVPDGDTGFYISTNKNLYAYKRRSKQTDVLTGWLPSNDLLHICRDPDNGSVLWIGTLSDGLIRFGIDSHASSVFSIATGLPNNTIYSIIPGNDHLLWCSSNKGLFAFNKKNQTVTSYSSRDGLLDDEFNRFYYMQLPGGDLAFGGPLGYTIFNPAKLASDTFAPAIRVTAVNVNHAAYFTEAKMAADEMHLKYDQNFIEVVFAAMQFDFPEKLQYRHRLIGLDPDWIITGNDNKATYTSLPPGVYTLQLNATNTAGRWSRHITSIRITITPPFWKTWWFYLSMALLLSAVIYAFLFTRIRSIKQAQEQKLLFEREALELHAMALRAQMNPHFIFNCLNSIKALIQEKQDQQAVNYLTTFAVLIRKQLSNKSNEVWLKDELQTCRLYLELEAMRFGDRIRYAFSVDENDEELLYTKVPPLILQPIVENAIIHGLLPKGEGGSVTISVFRNEDHCVCEITDNGIGRAASELNKQKTSSLHRSEGLHLLEERIAMNNQVSGHIDSIQTIDLYDVGGHATGTKVIIQFYITL